MAATPQKDLPEPPMQLKAIQSYMRVAQDVERYDPVVAYWLRLYSTDYALKIDKDSPESKEFLSTLISWLEKYRKSNEGNETVTNRTVGEAHFENFVMSLFNKADTLDCQGTANKNTVKMFYMASVMFEAMSIFGQLTEEVSQKAKYAKFKAAYIQKCLKTGQTPKPGPVEGADLEGTGGSSTTGEADPSAGSAAPPATPSTAFPQMPTPGNPSEVAPAHSTVNTDNGGSGGPGGLYIPEVPKDTFDNTGPAAAIIPPKPTDPYIMTPSVTPYSASSTDRTSNVTCRTEESTRSTIAEARFLATNGTPLKPEDIVKGQKYCKFANSALQYDDIPTAVANLQKALKLLTTGQNPEQ